MVNNLPSAWIKLTAENQMKKSVVDSPLNIQGSECIALGPILWTASDLVL